MLDLKFDSVRWDEDVKNAKHLVGCIVDNNLELTERYRLWLASSLAYCRTVSQTNPDTIPSVAMEEYKKINREIMTRFFPQQPLS